MMDRQHVGMCTSFLSRCFLLNGRRDVQVLKADSETDVTVTMMIRVQGRMIARGPAGPANAERTGSLFASVFPSLAIKLPSIESR